MIDIVPGILEKNFAEIERKLRLVAPYISWVHLDVADNTLVPNTLFSDFGMLAKLLNEASMKSMSLEAHIMCADPVKYIKPLADAGVKRLTAHVEANDPRIFLDEAKYESVEVGLAIDGPTEIEQIEAYLDEIDFVHVLAIEAGFSGQQFMPETAEKIRLIRENFPDLPISVDGGMNDRTARIVREAGATRVVVTSYFWDNVDNIPHVLKTLGGK